MRDQWYPQGWDIGPTFDGPLPQARVDAQSHGHPTKENLLLNMHTVTFQVFFIVFFLLVVLGLFHGLIFLPVVLSLIGPESITTAGQQLLLRDDEAASAPAATKKENRNGVKAAWTIGQRGN